MAANQAELHEKGRQGEKIAKSLVGGRLTRHTAPFDLVEFNNRIAYEVKTVSGYSTDLKVHIADSSWKRKMAYAERYDLTCYLIVVVIYSKDDVHVYRSGLVQAIRPNQMERIK